VRKPAMSASQVLICYSDHNDPLVRIARECERDGSFHLVHVDEILPYAQPVEWPEVLRIALPEKFAQRFDTTLTINRLFNFANTETSSKLLEWGVNERWLHIKVSKYLLRGRQLAHDLGQRGVSRCLLPLNTQWFLLNREDASFPTPMFSFAMGYEAPQLEIMAHPMQKSVWSFFDWKEEQTITPLETRRHRFFVDSPTGIPVIAFYFGSDVEYVFPKQSTTVDRNMYERLAHAARKIFRSEAGELLTYMEDDRTVRFYGFSPFLYSSRISDRFMELGHGWLDRALH